MHAQLWPARRQRHQVQLEAEVVHPEGGETPTIVSNLSLEGCRINGWFRIGEAVALRLPRIGVVKGQVRWAMNGMAGVRFQPQAGQGQG